MQQIWLLKNKTFQKTFEKSVHNLVTNFLNILATLNKNKIQNWPFLTKNMIFFSSWTFQKCYQGGFL